jgi:hypothetical protein
VLDAVRAGGTFAAYQRAFAALEDAPRPKKRSLSVLAHDAE